MLIETTSAFYSSFFWTINFYYAQTFSRFLVLLETCNEPKFLVIFLGWELTHDNDITTVNITSYKPR